MTYQLSLDLYSVKHRPDIYNISTDNNYCALSYLHIYTLLRFASVDRPAYVKTSGACAIAFGDGALTKHLHIFTFAHYHISTLSVHFPLSQTPVHLF